MTSVARIGLCWVGSALLLACGFTPAASDRADGEQDSAVVLTWSRQGGFAGFCDELKVTVSGDASASSCKTSGVKAGRLSDDDLRRLNQWRAAFGSITVTSKDAATADAMTLTLSFRGSGGDQPSETQRQELIEWAQRVYLDTSIP